MNFTAKQLGFIASGCFLSGVLLDRVLTWWLCKSKFSLYCNSSLISIDDKVWPFNTQYKVQNKHVLIINTKEEFQAVLPWLKRDLLHVKLLGLDCEWSSFNKKQGQIALLQLATISGLCILIRMCLYEGNLPKFIEELLHDKDIIKVGVGVHDDARKLFSDRGLAVNGCVDLRALVMQNVPYSLSLKNLAAAYLGISMEKSKKVQCSDWEAETLSEQQVSYAANDALVASYIFSKIMLERVKCNVKLDHIMQSAISDKIWQIVSNDCKDLVDQKYKQCSHNHPGSENSLKQNQRKVENIKPFKSYSIRRQPLYENCKIEAPDGQLLSTCDLKKANWYISKELADVVCEIPFTVRLRFEPAGRPSSDQDYYLFDKDNICVVCGDERKIVRKNIVPHEYRRHFPLSLKDHVSHDVVPLCVSCHQKAGWHDGVLRNKIAVEFDAPLGSMQTAQLLEDPERRSVRSAGRALLKDGNKIPEIRKKELMTMISNFFNLQGIDDEVVEQAAKLETRYKNEAYVAHGEKVVTTLYSADSLEALIDFEKRWREHFLTTMQPKHMPFLWSVDHTRDRLSKRNTKNVESVDISENETYHVQVVSSSSSVHELS